jgi:UDP-N-acetylmuramate--alanine ligase
VDAAKLTSFSLGDEDADLTAANIVEEPLAIRFDVRRRGRSEPVPVRLQVPGRHNVSNALAALAAAEACGIELAAAAEALAGFKGLRRRFEVVGTKNGISVIDDFAHNPDKIAATLETLHAFPGRLLILFQPHGYGPLRVMGRELIDCFARELAEEDVLILPDPAYFGGTVERTVGSGDIVEGVRAAGRKAEHIPERAAAGARLRELAREGDRIIIMGARDDTLSIFAAELLAGL